MLAEGEEEGTVVHCRPHILWAVSMIGSRFNSNSNSSGDL